MKDELRVSHYAPGLGLCLSVAAIAFVLAQLEIMMAGRSWLEPLVLAIMAGTAVRTLWNPSPAFTPGIRFAAKTLLEAAVVLMGATISFAAIFSAGMGLLAGIVATVFIMIAAGFAIGRLMGLPTKMALLVSCGNSICGNSAIAAVAPVINAEGDDVATAIAFTAVLSIAVVLLIPIVASSLHLGPAASGAFAGLTVYAVPQVLVAAAPMGTMAVQLGTIVKLVRVLMLGPVVVCLSMIKFGGDDAPRHTGGRYSLLQLVPAFILAFLALAAARSFDLLPETVVSVAHGFSVFLTILAMAALGLDVDLRQILAAGPRVSVAVIASLLLLVAIALVVIRLTGME